MTHDAVSRLSAKLNGPITLTPRKSVAAVEKAVHAFPRIDESAKAHNPSGAPPFLSENSIRSGAVDSNIEEGRPFPIPGHWLKGQLLNVRNNGAEYVVTVLGEEFDPRYPERALKFDNSWTCQQFISKWYARESHDPRAF